MSSEFILNVDLIVLKITKYRIVGSEVYSSFNLFL